MKTLFRKATFDGWSGRWVRRARRRLNRACITLVAYHSISRTRCLLSDGGSLRHSPAEFERQIEYLAEHFRLVSLRDLVSALQKGTTLDRVAAVTLDDGYADALRVAAPILYRRRIPVTLFPVTSVIGNRDLLWQHKLAWLLASGHERRTLDALCEHGLPDREPDETTAVYVRRVFRPDVPEILESVLRSLGVSGPRLAASLRPYLEPEEIADADPEFVDFGNHTHTHPVLSACTPDGQRRELETARQALADLTGRAPVVLAYPFGLKRHYTEETTHLARETGHLAALDLRRRVNRPGADPMDLSRKPAPHGSLLLFEKLIEDWPLPAPSAMVGGMP